jgi:hypothetical protein
LRTFMKAQSSARIDKREDDCFFIVSLQKRCS